MTTIDDVKTKLKTITTRWFYLKEEIDSQINILEEMSDQYQLKYFNYEHRNKNVVTDSGGHITVEAKPTIPSKTSDLTNDSGFITSHQDISGKADSSDFDTLTATVTYTDNTSETVTFYVVPTQNNSS